MSPDIDEMAGLTSQLALSSEARITGKTLHPPGLYVGCRDSNSNPVVYATTSLTADLSLQPLPKEILCCHCIPSCVKIYGDIVHVEYTLYFFKGYDLENVFTHVKNTLN